MVQLEQIIKSPLTWFSGAFGAGFLGLADPTIQFLNATSGLWLPLVLMSEQLAGYVPAIPQSAVSTIVPVAIATYIGLLLYRLINRIRDYIDDS
jgi:hypothetical protein